MTKKIILRSLLGLLLIACADKSNESSKLNIAKEIKGSSAEVLNSNTSDVFYHYSIWWAFVNKIFEGDIDAKELKTKGDMALGSYNFLDGELIMLDGVLYQAKEDGTVVIPNDDEKIAYANAAFFDSEKEFSLKNVANYDELRDLINDELPSKNFFYAFKIHGNFKQITCGGLHKQDKPFEKGLDVLIPSRPLFERENFSGTMVGFYCPEFIGNINVAGYHLHFISDDGKFAGHVMEFEAEDLLVQLDQMHEYQFVLPKTEDYSHVGFEKEFQYKKK
ncbi:acetolactate decarboxylase [Namhaeicola litoreus]|uniref:Alpha-acetolactate decarboxylase n=1 Tax=Namhaeicola litoreus TaxID=1052145 RepID=A0ABW3Y4M2_9FLAO